jgi:hydroxymethylpyrimidine/phosphomethylpyrimidine kinase
MDMTTSGDKDNGITAAMTVAGFDPSAGAGVTADTRSMYSAGVYCAAAVTAVTVQNTGGVTSIQTLDRSLVARQLDIIIEDINPAACKTGMLPTAGIVAEVAARADAIGRLVVDPVFVSTSGADLVDEAAVIEIREALVPQAVLVTPNIEEAQKLSGLKVENIDDALAAAAVILELGAVSVCVTGGHWQGPPVDVFVDKDGPTFFESEDRLSEGELHGTGCLFSALAAAHIASGASELEAVGIARESTQRAIIDAVGPGTGLAIPWPRTQA